MSKKNHKNKQNPNVQEVKNVVSVETPTAKTTPSYITGTIYFLLMSVFLYFGLYLNNYKYTDFIATALFILYFVVIFFISKKNHNTTKSSIWIPTKLLLMILGIAFSMNFFATGINYITQTNIQSQNVFDIKNYAEEILKYEDLTIYGDIENKKLFFFNEKLKKNQVLEFDLVEENNFNQSTLNSTQTFFDIENNLRFSYLTNNDLNEIVLQWEVGEKRYLSTVNAEQIIELIKSKDSYETPIFATDNLEIYQLYNPGFMLVFTDKTVQLSEYDTILDIKDSNYIDRVYTFLNNHYDSEYVLNENASGELLAERIFEDKKINFYALNCVSCQYKYGNSDIGEIIDGETSLIFNINVPTSLLKEGK